MSIKKIFWHFLGNSAFDPTSIQSKFAGWWKDETDTYVTDQLGYQDRQALTQNSLAGQLFPGRSIEFAGNTDRAIVQDNGALDIGSNSAFSLAFWIKWDSFTGFARVMGKMVNGSTNGEYYISTGGSAAAFNVRGAGGLASSTIIGTVSTGTWYHIIATIDTSQVLRCYVNGALAGATPTISGAIPAIANTTGFGLNCSVTTIASPTGYSGTTQFRDVRIFKGHVLTEAERQSVYAGNYVSGFTEWWPLSDNSTTRLHSAKNGGLHFTATGLTGSSLKTGFYRQVYNDYGYAEDATFGQVPPDLTSLTDGRPTIDCYGNALVFKGSAKLNLIKSGSNYVMFSAAESDQLQTLRQSCDVIALNTWWSGTTAQSIAASSVAVYDASRQFYDATNKNLIIMKADAILDSYYPTSTSQGIVTAGYLTESEENSLMSYMGNPTIPTSYHANTVSLIARFTNSYTDKEKSRIDNVMRLLVASGIYTKLEGFSLSTFSGTEEQLLDWINASYNISPIGVGDTVQLPYNGLVPQSGAFKTGFVPSSGSKFLQNDCFISFKLGVDYKIPSQSNLLIGSVNTGVSSIAAGFTYGTNVNAKKSVQFYLNTLTAAVGLVNNIETNRTYIGNRTSSSSVNIVARRQLITTLSNTSVARNGLELYVGNANISTGPYIPNNNFFHHCAWGAALTLTESKLFAAIVDNFCNGQLLLAGEWIQDAGFKYKVEGRMFLDRIGDQVLWSDMSKLYYSTDGGNTITSSIDFDSSVLGYFQMCHLFDNGKIIFGVSKNKFYKTTTALSSITEMTPTKNGSPYTVHTPANASYPGEYPKWFGINKKQYLDDGTEIFAYNNIATSLLGAGPTLLFYSFGDDIKIGYEFGTNPYVRDNGTQNGGTSGTFLGDAAVLNWTRHGHGLQQSSADKSKFIAMYGDLDRAALAPAAAPFFECQWLQHAYDQLTDTWTTTTIKESGQSTRWKSASAQMPGDGWCYWTSDSGILSGTPPSNQSELGYFKSPIATLGISGDVRFYTPLDLTKPSGQFHLDSDGFFIGGGYSTTGVAAGGLFSSSNIIYSNDMSSFIETKLKVPGDQYCYRITKISYKRYQMDWMPDYNYNIGVCSVIIDFN